MEIQRKRPERPEGSQFETIAVVDAAILATVTLGVEPQPSAAGLPSEPPAETVNGHRRTRRYGHTFGATFASAPTNPGSRDG